VFDGVHLGHQRMLHQLLEMAAELGGVPTVITFRVHPDELLKGEAPPLLVSVPHRLRLLRRAGVQRLVLLDFDRRVRETTAEAFTDDVLCGALRIRGLLLGFDSALGKNREGTPERFAELGRERGFEVRTGDPLLVDGERVSSTAIRAAIAAGDLALAQRFLGRWPSTFGPVEHGAGRGRTMGFPTANVRPHSNALPPEGVYAVEVIVDGETVGGVANLGRRPTFDDGGTAPTLEVHLLDFGGDLYGQDLEVCFLAFLRRERKFANREELERQIQADVTRAREVLSN